MLALCVGLALAVLHGSAMQPSKGTLVYIGTYTSAKSKGIYVSRLDLAAGTLSAPVLAAESANPSFLAVHPTRDLLYAVNEIGTYEGKPGGSVSAFAINRETGALTALNRQSSVGGGPAHLTVDHGGRNVLVANYGGGSVAVLPIGADGALKPSSAFIQHTGSSVNPARQKEPHAHSVIVDSSRSIRLRRRPRPRQDHDLSVGRGERAARGQRPAVCGRRARRRPASSRAASAAAVSLM